MDKQELENFLNGVSVPVAVLDANLAVIGANIPARETFADLADGVRADKAITRKPGFHRQLRTSLEDRVETTAKVTLNQGFAQEFLATIRPFRSEGAQMLMITFVDRSSHKDVKSMRSDFVANVSHEIRSPLTAISGFVETLRGAAKDDPEAQAHFLSLMQNEVRRMANLVTDLLSLSQVEVKERRALKKTVNPNQIITEAVTAVSSLVEKRGRGLDVKINGALPNLPGKHDDLVRVLINLLENAVNYSRENSRIQLSAATVQGNNPLGQSALCIVVSDQGDGIPMQDIPRLTERFYRVDKSRSRNVGGTGLGLAIVKHILVRHRGRLVIESTVGQGSTFTVFLPLGSPTKS